MNGVSEMEERKENRVDTKDFKRTFSSALRAVGAASALVLAISIMRSIDRLATRWEIEMELEEELGEDFIRECRQDEECSKKLNDLIETCVDARLSEPREEEWKKEKRRKEILAELKRRLEELGIKIYTDYEEYEGYRKCYIMIGGIEFYGKDCQVTYREEVFDEEEVMGV